MGLNSNVFLRESACAVVADYFFLMKRTYPSNFTSRIKNTGLNSNVFLRESACVVVAGYLFLMKGTHLYLLKNEVVLSKFCMERIPVNAEDV